MGSGPGWVRALFGRSSRRRSQQQLTYDLLCQVTSLTKEIRNANRIQLHRIGTSQTEHAIADPALAEAISTVPGLSDRKRRQLLFVNAQYAYIVLNYRVGAICWDELIGHVRVLGHNSVFEDYWEMTRDPRKSLPRESLEAKVGKAVDVIMDELADNPEEWWVVGPDTGSS